jgi:hypothetical protein
MPGIASGNELWLEVDASPTRKVECQPCRLAAGQVLVEADVLAHGGTCCEVKHRLVTQTVLAYLFVRSIPVGHDRREDEGEAVLGLFEGGWPSVRQECRAAMCEHLECSEVVRPKSTLPQPQQGVCCGVGISTTGVWLQIRPFNFKSLTKTEHIWSAGRPRSIERGGGEDGWPGWEGQRLRHLHPPPAARSGQGTFSPCQPAAPTDHEIAELQPPLQTSKGRAAAAENEPTASARKSSHYEPPPTVRPTRVSRDRFSDYDDETTARCERALVTLLGDIGPWSERIYLADGLAPRYLVGQLPVGSADACRHYVSVT